MWEAVKEITYIIFSTPAQAVLYAACVIVLLLVMKKTGFTVKKGEGFYFKEKEKKEKGRNRRAEDSKGSGQEGGHPTDNCRRVFDKIETALTEINLENTGMAKILTELKETLDNIKLDHKKVIFYSNAPDVLRLQAGLEFIKAGGNGHFKAKVLSEAAKYPHEYDYITAKHPDLFIGEIDEKSGGKNEKDF